MKIVLLGAAGFVGRAAARELSARPEVRELVLVDYNIRDAKKFAKSLSPKCAWKMADVGRDPDLDRILEGVAAVAGAVGPCAEYEKGILLSCARRGAPVASIGDGTLSEADRREVHDACRRGGAPAVSGCGLMPGWTELLAARFLSRDAGASGGTRRYLFCSLDRFGGYAFFRRMMAGAVKNAPSPPGGRAGAYFTMGEDFLGLPPGRPAALYGGIGGALGTLGVVGRELCAASLFWLRGALAAPPGTPAAAAGVWAAAGSGAPSFAAVDDPKGCLAGVLLAETALRLAALRGREKGLLPLPEVLGAEDAEKIAATGGGRIATGTG